MSFTTGSLFHRESVKLAELYLDYGEWSAVRDKVIAENLLQTRTLNTLKRVCREVISRIRALTPTKLEFLVKASHQEQAYLLWIAVCRRYRFIADFAVEVLRERYITLKTDLTYEDFNSFFNRKSEWHPELDEINPATRSKFAVQDTSRDRPFDGKQHDKCGHAQSGTVGTDQSNRSHEYVTRSCI